MKILALFAACLTVVCSAHAASYEMKRAVPTLVVDSGVAPSPLAHWQSTTLDFSGVPVGSSATRSLVLSNVGTAPGNFSQFSAPVAGLQVDASACAQVAPGSSCNVTLTYAPSGMTALAAAGLAPVGPAHDNLLSITGTGLLSSAALSTASLSFVGVDLGSTSSVQTVALTNSGNTELAVGQLNVTGPFTADTDCASALAVGTLCHINVRFVPEASGNATGAVTLQSAAGVQTVALSGTAVTATYAFEDTAGNAVAQLDFSTPLGTAAASQTVYLKNTGTASLSVSSVAAPAPFMLAANSCNSVAPGARCALSVSFTPSAQTSFARTLSVTSNATSGATLTLNGTGAAPTYALLSASTAKIPANAGLSADKLTLSAIGGGTQVLVSTNLAGKTSGKWYFEVTPSNSGCTFCEAGVMPASAIGTATNGGASPVGYAYYFSGAGGTGGGISNGTNSWLATTVRHTSGTPVGVALDLDARQVTFKLSGGTYGPYNLGSPVGTAYVPFVSAWGGYMMTANFGQTAFVRGVPAGYTAGWY